MTRLRVAFVVPAVLLGCLTMSVVLVVGHAEISQLRPNERRMAPVVERAESPFRVIAGVRVPDPAPPRESVPSPSAAAAPEATDLPEAPVPAPPDVPRLVPQDLPEQVAQAGRVRRTVDDTVDRTPDGVENLLEPVVDTAFGVVHAAAEAVGVGDLVEPVTQASHQAAGPAVREARDAHAEATGDVRDSRERLEPAPGL